MDRLTRAIENGVYAVDDGKIQLSNDGYSGEAINKLAKFENIYDDLVSKQSVISMEMERLRAEGKTHTVKFKQLLANKLTNSNIITIFEMYGLK